VKFEDLCAMLRANYKLKKNRSTRRMELALKHLGEHFAGDRAIDITGDRIAAYAVARQEAGASDASVQKELAALKRAFNVAVKVNRRLSTRPPFPEIRVHNVREGFFDSPDVERLVQELPDYLQPVVRFSYWTGWRKQEILGLTWSQVDRDGGVIRLPPDTTKNRKGRELAYRALPALVDIIEGQWTKARETEKATAELVTHVFHRNGKPIKDMMAAWRSATKRAGLEGWLFHDLRRSAVRNLERAGVSRSVAMSVTGHVTEAVYKRYAITDQKVQEEGLAKLAALHATHEPSKVIPMHAKG
jgi:integrase